MQQSGFDFGKAFNTKKFTEDQRTVFELIEKHSGKENAISAPALTRLTNIPDRRLRSIVKELVEQRFVPICSCPAGYYLPATDEEIMESVHTYLSWAFSTIKRAYVLKRNPHLKRLAGQLELELKRASAAA